jgi:hypothetical protein
MVKVMLHWQLFSPYTPATDHSKNVRRDKKSRIHKNIYSASRLPRKVTVKVWTRKKVALQNRELTQQRTSASSPARNGRGLAGDVEGQDGSLVINELHLQEFTEN